MHGPGSMRHRLSGFFEAQLQTALNASGPPMKTISMLLCANFCTLDLVDLRPSSLAATGSTTNKRSPQLTKKTPALSRRKTRRSVCPS